MHERHAAPDAIRRFLRAELPAGECSVLVRHLLERCPDCSVAARRLAWISPGQSPGQSPSQSPSQSSRAPLPVLRRAAYGEAFAAAERRLGLREQELTRQRALAVEQWRELRRHPPVRRRWRVRNDPRFGTWGFCERLLEESLALGRRDPGQTGEIADLAVEAVSRLEAERYGSARLADLEALAWGAVGEARRLQLDLAGAGEALSRARTVFGRGTGDVLDDARLVCFEGSLGEDLGEVESAVKAFGWAARVFRRAGETRQEGIALLLRAKAAGQLDPGRGMALLDQALERIDRGDRGDRREPWIELCARHHRISFLDALGRARQAALLLAASRGLYRPFTDLRTRLALRWLEGRIARSLGDLDVAERSFEELLPVFAGRGLRFQLSRLALDLAGVYQERGTPEKILPLVIDADEADTNCRTVH